VSIALLQLLYFAPVSIALEPPSESAPVSAAAARASSEDLATVEDSSSVASDDTADRAETPPGLTEYLGRKIAQTMHYTGASWLIRESRQREEDCEDMLSQLRVQPGMTICDMGCGNGFYSIPLARRVQPGGRVLAVDIQREMLLKLQIRAEDAKVQNIQRIHGTVADPRLPANSVDLILCVDVYHEFSHPTQMLAAMRRALTREGRMVLVEFREEDPDVPILPLHKMSKKQILKEMIPNGFKLVRQYDKLPWQHMMFFARDDSPIAAIDG
jgi:ubiquinone/menaquinone biosynthesis C-methylase UbiE